jgi:hypothetical protein
LHAADAAPAEVIKANNKPRPTQVFILWTPLTTPSCGLITLSHGEREGLGARPKPGAQKTDD